MTWNKYPPTARDLARHGTEWNIRKRVGGVWLRWVDNLDFDPEVAVVRSVATGADIATSEQYIGCEWSPVADPDRVARLEALAELIADLWADAPLPADMWKFARALVAEMDATNDQTPAPGQPEAGAED